MTDVHAPPFDVPWFLELLRAEGSALGEPFSLLQQTPSTNDVAKQAAREGAPSGATFLAEHQTAGRGRRGRAWHSEPGRSLLFSVIIDSRLPPEKLSPVTLAVGVGLLQALTHTSSLELKLKWPNDILCGDKKLAGILVESESISGRRRLIVGVGVNVGTSFPPELDLIATSLALQGADVRREELLASALRSIHQWIERLERGELTQVVAEVQRCDALRDREVLVEGVRGTARGIDAGGQLLLQVEDKIRTVASGTVEIQR